MLHVDLEQGVATICLHQMLTPDYFGTVPFALLRCRIKCGVGVGNTLIGDWQMGARIVVLAERVEVSAFFDVVESRDPLPITVTASVVDGAPAAPTPWGYSHRCANLDRSDKQVIQVPEGAHDVALFAPTVASWGGIMVRQQSAQGASTIIEDTPVDTRPVELLPGARWVEVENITTVLVRPWVRFGLA